MEFDFRFHNDVYRIKTVPIKVGDIIRTSSCSGVHTHVFVTEIVVPDLVFKHKSCDKNGVLLSEKYPDYNDRDLGPWDVRIYPLTEEYIPQFGWNRIVGHINI